MKRRRLHRYSQALDMSARHIANDQQTEFDRGVHYGLNMAMRQYERMKADAAREAQIAANIQRIALSSRRETVPAYDRSGYDAGYRDGLLLTKAHNSSQQTNRFTQADIESARQRGFEEGRLLTANKPSAVDEASIRKKAIEDMLESCRVIAESNPNMDSKSFFGAVKHRSKKV